MNCHSLIEASALKMASGELTLEEYLIVSASVAGAITGTPIGYNEISRITGKGARAQRRIVSQLEEKGLVTRKNVRGVMKIKPVFMKPPKQTTHAKSAEKPQRQHVKTPTAWKEEIRAGKKEFPDKTFTAKPDQVPKLQKLFEKHKPSDIDQASWDALRQKANCPLSYLSMFIDDDGSIKPENRAKPPREKPKPATPPPVEEVKAKSEIKEPECRPKTPEEEAKVGLFFQSITDLLSDNPKSQEPRTPRGMS